MMTRWCAIGAASVLAMAAGCSGDDEGGSSVNAGGNLAMATGGTVFGTGGTVFGSGGSTSGGGGPSGGGTAGASTAGAGFGGTSSPPPNACEPQADDEGCVGERYEGESTPLDIYVMFDRSCSMSCPAELGGPGRCCMGGPNPRIAHVRRAMEEFLRDPRSAGIGVGIGYFGYMQAGRTSCDPSEYSEPDVPMGLLPGYADRLVQSLDRAEPTGETPTGAAIRGACTYAAQWQTLHPAHSVVVLLVTDGVPEAPTTSQNGGCTPTIEDAVQAATTCAGHELPIYVLGVGQALQNLNQIAEAGGTGQAYLVEGGDVSAQVLAALNAIRADAAIPCELSLPDPPQGETLNLREVNVGFCDAGGSSQTFYYVESESECDPAQGGWYYDDAASPERVHLCGATCDQVTIPGGSLFMSVGCSRRGFIQ